MGRKKKVKPKRSKSVVNIHDIIEKEIKDKETAPFVVDKEIM